jgi:prolyl 4-hydroxylase
MFLARLSWILVALLPSMVRGESFPDDSNIVQSECPHQPYKVHIFSRHPLVIYIENFVSAEEALQLTTTA